MKIITRIKAAIIFAIESRIEAEMENIMDVCISAGADIQASIEEALKF